jgi:23S rRNA (cytidine1920-2'-O)/16S rRNA (cytidine1409-2'-O)-methyltransferase
VRPAKRAARKRLDVLLVERGLAESRQKAQAAVLAGEVFVAGKLAVKAGSLIPPDTRIEVVARKARFVSRGGEKLAGALEDFGVRAEGRVCLDVGCSTGGFTDCLLQHRARRVFAVDVSTDQLDWRLRQDDRVVLIEKNARNLVASDLPEAPELITVDISFISVSKVLPALVRLAAPPAEMLILVKPQFELERGDVGRGGIVRDPKLHRRAVERIAAAATGLGLSVLGRASSRLPGAEGNQEFFLHVQLL